VAYSIWDAAVNHLFLPPMYGPVVAGDVAGVAHALGLSPAAVAATVSGFNQAVAGGPSPGWDPARWDPSRLDGCRTEGLVPPKSNWARPIDTPPFYGIAMRPGVTFTFMGVQVTREARVRTTDGEALRNVFAAGEVMSGNVLSSGYLGGFGLTIGTVWGRIAGAAAAAAAREPS
jgi:tricarballylate dehydrogenase